MPIKTLNPETFFNLDTFPHKDLFTDLNHVWDALKRLPDYIQSHLKRGSRGRLSPLASIDENVFIGEDTVVEAGVVIKGPTIIGARCEIRSGAYIRENTLIADEAVIGHATEVKHSILFKGVSLPHFAFVGDSILGWKSHLGAGVKIANFKINSQPVTVKLNHHIIETGLLKFGAVLGDGVEIGCNTVLNPGTCVGKNTLICANLLLGGIYGENLFIKLKYPLEIQPRRLD